MERREFLALAPAAAAAVTATATVAAPLDMDAGLAECIARFHKAQAETDRWHEQVCDPAHVAYLAEIEAIPHVTAAVLFDNPFGGQITLSTNNKTSLEIARQYVGPESTEFARCCRELLAAEEDRKRQCEAIADKFRLEALCQESDAYTEAANKAFWEVEGFPVRTFPGLLAKYRLLAAHNLEYVEPARLMEDLKRVEDARAVA